MDFNDLLNLMVEKKSSDLFITDGVAPSMKINGQIVPISKNSLSGEVIGQLLHSIMSEKQRREFAETRECNFAIMNREKNGAFSCQCFSAARHAGHGTTSY